MHAKAQDVQEEKAIKKVIQSAYIDGLQNKGDIEAIKAGFHPGFNPLGVRDNTLTKFPIYSWLEYFSRSKEEKPEPPEHKVSCEYKQIDICGNAAMAKIELYKEKKLIFTDYLSLYKFNEGWRIVNKIYHRHE